MTRTGTPRTCLSALRGPDQLECRLHGRPQGLPEDDLFAPLHVDDRDLPALCVVELLRAEACTAHARDDRHHGREGALPGKLFDQISEAPVLAWIHYCPCRWTDSDGAGATPPPPRRRYRR